MKYNNTTRRGDMSTWQKFVDKLNPWAGETQARADREERRDTNMTVANTHQNVSDLKKKRIFLQKKADKCKARAMAPSTAPKDAERLAQEWQHINKQIDQLDGLLRQIMGVSATIDTMATNAQAFDTMRQAQQGMATMTNQFDPDEVDDVMASLRQNVDDSDRISRAMTQQIFRNDGRHAAASSQYNQPNSAAQDILSQWRSEHVAHDMPSTPVSIVTSSNNVSSTFLHYQQKDDEKHANNDNNNNNNSKESIRRDNT